MPEYPTTAPKMKRTARDSVFCDLFSQKEYQLELYRALHPEDTTTTEDDLELVTIERVVTDGEYNDIGFTAGGRLLLLVEAQTDWSPNIVTRMLFYLTETYRRDLFNRHRSLHEPHVVEIPVPELYVIYTGPQDVPSRVTFSHDILGGAPNSAIEVTVNVLRGGSTDIVGQYVKFTEVIEEVRTDKSLAPGEKAAALVHRCLQRDILSTYMQHREQEVNSIMFTLFDQEYETQLYHERLKKQATEEGLAEGRAQGLAQGITEGLAEGRAQGITEGRAQGLAQSTENLMKAQNLTAAEAMDILAIPDEDRPEVTALL